MVLIVPHQRRRSSYNALSSQIVKLRRKIVSLTCHSEFGGWLARHSIAAQALFSA